MSTEIRLAFAHPSERSEATSPSAPLDRISLRDHIVEVEIGAFQAERGTTQRICFNVVVEVQPLTGPIDDDVDRILSYDRVTEAIADALAEERLNLLETLAERVAERILVEPRAMRVFVRIEKLDRGPGALGVEIVRARDPRCKVVSTRTELDWAMRNGQICVWAPSKIVLDAVDGPSAHPSDAVALAVWFAATFEADEMLVIGAELPRDPGVPLRSVPLEQSAL